MSVTAWKRRGGPGTVAPIPHGGEAEPAVTSYEDTYRSGYARLTRVAYLITGSNEAAEGVVQDAFVALYPRFPRVRSPEAYLYRSVVNGSRGWLRCKWMADRLGHRPVVTEVPAPELDETRQALDSTSWRRRRRSIPRPGTRSPRARRARQWLPVAAAVVALAGLGATVLVGDEADRLETSSPEDTGTVEAGGVGPGSDGRSVAPCPSEARFTCVERAEGDVDGDGAADAVALYFEHVDRGPRRSMRRP
jgi:hypothetical protein